MRGAAMNSARRPRRSPLALALALVLCAPPATTRAQVAAPAAPPAALAPPVAPPVAPSLALAAPPRLVVIVVVDQCRADYLQRFARVMAPDGIARLLAMGACWPNAAHTHTVTTTGPG